MYNHNLIEKKWIKKWNDEKTYKFIDDKLSPKFYVLDMFPYPSGSGLHVGHPKGYVASDIIARYKKFKGFNVLHPIGWDAFGLPAEQYALETKNHPSGFTETNINTFRNQLKKIGFSFDYDKEVNTTDENYYKWTQWIFTQLYKQNLAEIKEVDVNWCENLGTVLANEEVIKDDSGKMLSERGNHPVVKKPMKQWVLKITEYADKLIEGLDEIDWPIGLKNIQKKWIGKSEGFEIIFKVKDLNIDLNVFTSKPESIFGVTYIAIGPESKKIEQLKINKNIEVEKFINISKSKEEFERTKESTDSNAILTNLVAIHPITKKEIPIIIADYVIGTYASGIVMGVPSFDERDKKVALKYNLEFIEIVKDNKMINSEFINGLNYIDAKLKVIKYLEDNKLGFKKVNYKLRDWLFSRQRYWGEPFPILYDENNNIELIEDLPLVLPKTNNITPSKDGTSPLSNLTDWINVEINNKKYRRDSNTMPQWAGSCWYYLAYILKNDDGTYTPLNSAEAKTRFKRWLPVDIYIGGQEHAVLHLLYARFWNRFLYDIGVVTNKEPFQLVVNQGMILDQNNQKMSKSKGNVISVDDVINEYGADSLRIYEMFMGPLNSSLAWSDDSLKGSRKWIEKVFNLFEDKKEIIKEKVNNDALLKDYQLFLNNVSNNIEKLQFNLGVSDMMVFINACYKVSEIKKEYLKNFLIILSCYAPFVAEEINLNFFKSNDSITKEKWPKIESINLDNELINIPIQVNSKVRDVLKVKNHISEEELLILAKNNEKVKIYLNNKEIVKVIFVKNKILNLITK
ncbi:MAG: leucine--tRNA ligase [Mycoplasmoidaceae bacterium]